MGQLENEARVETAIARFDAASEAARMTAEIQRRIREEQERQMRNETGPDCE